MLYALREMPFNEAACSRRAFCSGVTLKSIRLFLVAAVLGIKDSLVEFRYLLTLTDLGTLYTRFVTGENAQVAADWIKQTASTVGDEAIRVGTEVIQSDLVQDAGKGALLGAVVAVPLPIIGPAIGASIGASVGVYKNLTKSEQSPNILPPSLENQTDFYREMLNLDELKQKGIISEDEFAILKKRFLDNYQS
jgi:hypothetical protein